MEKLNVIYYDEPSEEFTYCVLAPNVDGPEYAKKLNTRIKSFNADVEKFNNYEKELNDKHNVYKSFEEITGAERLNEREPKYPAEKPKGFKSVQEACPEITAERARRKAENEKNWKIYTDYTTNARETVQRNLQEYKAEMLEKWPEFKRWTNSESYERIIYGGFVFSQSDLRYVSEDLK